MLFYQPRGGLPDRLAVNYRSHDYTPIDLEIKCLNKYTIEVWQYNKTMKGPTNPEYR